MAQDPGMGYKITARVISAKGKCNSGHAVGEAFELSCHNTDGLCGYFYHKIFPSLSTFQFGGSYPWWTGDIIELECPDQDNQVILRLERTVREKNV